MIAASAATTSTYVWLLLTALVSVVSWAPMPLTVEMLLDIELRVLVIPDIPVFAVLIELWMELRVVERPLIPELIVPKPVVRTAMLLAIPLSVVVIVASVAWIALS